MTANAGLTINGNGTLSGRTLTLSSGTGTMSGLVGIAMASGAVFNNNSTFELSNDGGFAALSSFAGSGTFNNNGILRKTTIGNSGDAQHHWCLHQYRRGASAGGDVDPERQREHQQQRQHLQREQRGDADVQQ